MEFVSRLHIKVKNQSVWKKLFTIKTEDYWFAFSGDVVFGGVSDTDYVMDGEWGCPPAKLQKFVKELATVLDEEGIVVADNYCLSVDPYTYVYMYLGDQVRSDYFEWPNARRNMWELYKEGNIADLKQYLSYGNYFRFSDKELKVLESLDIHVQNPQKKKTPAKKANADDKYKEKMQQMESPIFQSLLENQPSNEEIESINENDFVCNPNDYTIKNGKLIKYKGKGKAIIIPDGVKCIGDSAFCQNTNIIAVRLPKSLTCIEHWAFYGCSNLCSITLENVSSYDSQAFFETAIKEATISGAAKELPYGLFYRCSQLEKVTIEDGVEKIGKKTFAFCPRLTTFVIKGKLKSKVGSDAFDFSPMVTVYGIPGSKAEDLARDNGVKFLPLDSAPV